MTDPGDDLLPISRAEMLVELNREIAMRALLYPRMVADRRMKQVTADRRIRVLQAIHAAIAAESGAVAPCAPS